ncbi:33 kDa chaperonin [Vibrio aerogenes CECT 7868]|uniref:33 kDa chaperonin n=1 Tax=Vibrio aerogenes CECT 7868 TaxID=1216006 RepID=A0A1M5YUK4_9VIBR|nr:Hsp33 family molecular chaperone HslO [Vibrio aerogenes]SHI15609.1 33 kDa chaperonin [Vibrio aerogenes CECT 7868]
MTSNVLNRYLFENLSVRGELVQLDETYQQLTSGQTYPAPVKALLGELLVATTLLTATMKFEGSITIQLQGDGAVSLAVINGDHNQQVRGVARWEGEIPESATLHQLMGKGHLVITIEPEQGERYQGIVGLDGDNLAEVLEGYFEHSEQLKTKLWIHTSETHAAGMLLQVLPDGTGSPDDFEHLEQLTATISAEELFSLQANDLLYRLYHQEEIKLFQPQPVAFQCNCSRQRTGRAITTLPADEVNKLILQDGHITLHCDYCGTTYHFTEDDVNQLFAGQPDSDRTIH